jgi:hypothetical protein
MTDEQILAIVRSKREIHPELARPLGWNGFRRILAREDISLVVTAMAKRDAQLICFDGQWAILLNSNSCPRRHLYYGVHELGHLWCHHDPPAARDRSGYTTCRKEGDEDPREGEAELFCVYVLGGRRFQEDFLDALYLSRIAHATVVVGYDPARAVSRSLVEAYATLDVLLRR